ncbi:MAG: PE-PGRS family protein, partial [Myxococcota bacterium]
VLAAGTYRLDATLPLAASGTAAAPITLRGDGATIESDTVEALKISGAHWHVEDLRFVGVCAVDDDCEHALHIVGAADGTWLRDSVLVDFNAQVKGNGEDTGAGYEWPDDVVIEGNDLHDTRPRSTANPVTKIDVVGGRRWRVEANRISDFEKAGGDAVSYAAFLKGNSRDGVFARNLVVCSEAFTGGVRVGLSLGGGGTSPDTICEDGTCSPEHQGGVIRNNVIARCDDVGVYLNEAADTRVLANTLYATAGIDVRFPASTVELANNLLDADIRERDGGTATRGTNWEGVALGAVFADPDALDFTLVADPGVVDAGDARADVTDDFCGNAREPAQDGGALEYTTAAPCDTTVAHPAADPDSGDTGDTGAPTDTGDTGTPDTGTPDTGTPGDPAPTTDAGCGCATAAPARLGVTVLLALVVAVRRRVPAGPRCAPARSRVTLGRFLESRCS